jgi:hypothetical protein
MEKIEPIKISEFNVNNKDVRDISELILYSDFRENLLMQIKINDELFVYDERTLKAITDFYNKNIRENRMKKAIDKHIK